MISTKIKRNQREMDISRALYAVRSVSFLIGVDTHKIHNVVNTFIHTCFYFY